AKDAKEANTKMKENSILVTVGSDKEMMSALEKAAALITEEGGLTSHAAVVGLNLGIPVIVGVDNATRILKDGTDVTVDSSRGLILSGHANVL
ncbi:MAG: pyruvate kinase, partial [Bacillales bacterium]|nr:pyruvate kinase [Bacillales bacterium]